MHTMYRYVNVIMNNIPSLGTREYLYILKYEEDRVICSVTSDGLQLGMNSQNSLHGFCVSNNLTVKASKSKAIYGSAKIKRNLSALFYNHESILVLVL